MTILEISILFHYRCCDDDYRQGDFSAPAVREAISRFHDDLGLLEAASRPKKQTFTLTERGLVYVEALQAVPLPVKKWVMPQEERAAG